MREIDKNLNFRQISKSDLNFGKNENTEKALTPELEDTTISDFSNPKAEALGRSQVNRTDNLKTDVDFAAANPKTIENSDKLFELAYEKLSEESTPNAYEEACSIATSEEAKAIL